MDKISSSNKFGFISKTVGCPQTLVKPFDKLPWVFGFTIISGYIPIGIWPGWGQSIYDNTKKEYSDPHLDVHTIEDVWPMTLNMRI